MPEQNNSPFTKLHVEEVTPAKRTLLDELNLPPKARKFIADNAKTLQIALIAFVVLISAWNFYNYYTQKQKNDSSALLAKAMQQTDTEARDKDLQQVIKEYSGSGAAMWSRITLAHEQVEKKDYAKAQEELAAIKKDVSTGSPLFPLVLFDLGQVYEMNGDLDNALSQYTALREIPGFVIIGYLGEARIYEQKNDSVKARETYEMLKTQSELEPAVLEWVEAKLAVK
ncbi:MAG: tetratricopeptide repeat protein [Proteobacteria bacterium]|nr:tetratricopeptide repeat protein [Pseudomonadota bacterium]MBU4295179.1 tetratricopeptide repeat protein [Pseudomonadota bacterium]MCG2749039.1 tetratricopeptide repeat protein [Desulfobulbaceae bacterium]